MGNGTAFQGAINHLVVIKRNTIENNGGIEVRGHTTNVLVEGNAVRNSSVGAPARTAARRVPSTLRPLTRGRCPAPGVHVNTTQASHVLLRNNDVQLS